MIDGGCAGGASYSYSDASALCWLLVIKPGASLSRLARPCPYSDRDRATEGAAEHFVAILAIHRTHDAPPTRTMSPPKPDAKPHEESGEQSGGGGGAQTLRGRAVSGN
jgi:hypothetical protein